MRIACGKIKVLQESGHDLKRKNITKEIFKMEDYRNEMSKADQDVKGLQPGMSDEVLIEIVHGIKEILLLLINKAFDRAFPETH